MKAWDIIIIGGGLAGAAAAIELAQVGKKVLLFEKETGPHHKVCGEFISSEARHYLSELGVDLKELGGKLINNICLIHGKKAVKAPLPFSAISLSRFILDENLLQLAVENGVDVRRGITINELFFAKDLWHVKWADGNSAFAPTVFLASGKHNLKGWNRGLGEQNDMIGFKMHFKLSEAQEKNIRENVEITLFDGGYAGLELIENGLVNLCLVVQKSKFAECQKSWANLLKYIEQSSGFFAERMKDARPCQKIPLAIFQVPYGLIYEDVFNEQPAGLYRLGDQMAVIPSFCGDGMAIALHSAHIAVQNYLHGDSQTYYQQIHEDLNEQMLQARKIARLIAKSRNHKMLYFLCAIFPRILTMIARKTRIEKISTKSLICDRFIIDD